VQVLGADNLLSIAELGVVIDEQHLVRLRAEVAQHELECLRAGTSWRSIWHSG
jgi:hypothetical protein